MDSLLFVYPSTKVLFEVWQFINIYLRSHRAEGLCPHEIELFKYTDLYRKYLNKWNIRIFFLFKWL